MISKSQGKGRVFTVPVASFMLCMLYALTAVFGPATAQAQSVVLDGSIGNGSTLGNGPVYGITEEMGRRIGNNLFQSFSEFSLLKDETADFTASESIQSILARVTGNTASTINGTLRAPTTLFFLNPNGVIFNADVNLDVAGSFLVSTADYLRSGASAFYVSESNANAALPSVFSIDPGVLFDVPDTFGFLSDSPASITVNDAFFWGYDGTEISLIGGDTTISGGTIVASGGRIDMVSVDSPGEAIFTDSSVVVDSFSSLGELRLTNGTIVNVDESSIVAEGAGTIIVRAGQLEVNDSFLYANTILNSSGGAIDIVVDGTVWLKNEAGVVSWTQGDGDGVPIRIVAEELEILEESNITAKTWAAGDAGDVTIEASRSVLISDPDGFVFLTGIQSNVTFGDGTAGDITIRTPTLRMEGGNIRADVGFAFEGEVTRGTPGNVRIYTNQLEMNDGARIMNDSSESTLPLNSDLVAQTEIRITPLDPNQDSVISLNGFNTGVQSISSESSRNSSNLVLVATDIRLSDAARISTAVSNGSASAGTITILVDRLTLDEGASIESEAQELSTGNAGEIFIRANESVSVLNPSCCFRETQINSTTRGTGDGGRIAVVVVNPGGTGRVTIDGPSAIQSNNFSPSSDSRSGDIRIDADVVRIENGGVVASFAADQSQGSAGSITIGATELLLVSGSDGQYTSSITTSTGGSGSGGELRISADRIVVADGGEVGSRTFSSGSGGAIRIGRAEDIPIDTHELVVEGGRIAADSVALGEDAGRSGSVIVEADRIVIDDGFISAYTLDGEGGELRFAAKSLLSISNRSLVTTATLGSGSAGEMRISGGRIVVSGGSMITSTTDSVGDGGIIRIGRDADIPIDTDELFVQDSVISVRSVTEGDNAGAAGSVILDVGRFVLDEGGQVLAVTSDGAGGTISLRAQESALLSGTSSAGFPSAVFSGTTGDGAGGSVTFETPRLQLQGGAEIGSSARDGSTGSAGDINLRVGTLELTGDSTVSAQSGGSGPAGTIDIAGVDAGRSADSVTALTGRITTASQQAGGGSISIDSYRILLSDDSLITTTVRSGTGSGNVTLSSRFVRLDDSKITADGGEGAGGNVAIVVSDIRGANAEPVGFLVLEDISEIRADGGDQGGKISIDAAGFTGSMTGLVQARARQPAGIDGEVGIQAIVAGVAESITPLPENFLDVSELLAARCAQIAGGGETSSFIVAGRDVLPPEPGGLLSSSVSDLEPETAAVEALHQETPETGDTGMNLRVSNPKRFWNALDALCPPELGEAITGQGGIG